MTGPARCNRDGRERLLVHFVLGVDDIVALLLAAASAAAPRARRGLALGAGSRAAALGLRLVDGLAQLHAGVLELLDGRLDRGLVVALELVLEAGEGGLDPAADIAGDLGPVLLQGLPGLDHHR